MTSTTTHSGMKVPHLPRPYWQKMNRWNWHLSPFAVIVMLVIPIFWPILAVIVFAGFFQVILQVVLAIVGNVVLYSAWLVAALFVLAFGRWL